MKPVTLTGDGDLPLDVWRRLDEACDRFEAAWRSGVRPDLAACLLDVPAEARARLLRELLALDLDYRRRGGDRPTPEEYRERFPEHPSAVDAAFASPGRTGGALTSDPDPGPGFGDRSTISWEGAVRPGPRDRPCPDVPESEALRAAGYEVLGELGRGGMGVVYRARQVALNRLVAVKTIRAAGWVSDEQRRRFRNEAEAVAQLDHPNIVPIYEVGPDYFSMKLIAGAGLDRRLAEFADDFRGSARLVAVAAGAIDHAHRRGILHRDLKPANVLVDERGEPHVTDFGLAKRIEGDGELTHSGAMMGSPSYMAPEQASGVPGSITTATDVYGLGTVLYALLTGRAPHVGSSLAETLDRVRGRPPDPPSRLNARVPRDLETICLKCLAGDPRHRYDSAQALADDLGRWLAGEPIAARPVGQATRAWMWCRRHPLPASLAAGLVLAVLGGSAGAVALWARAERERAVATASDAFTKDLLANASPALKPRGADVTVAELLDFAARTIGGKFDGQPEVEASIRETMGGAYLGLARFAEAEAQLRAAVALDARHRGPRARPTLRATNLLGDLLDQTGRFDRAEALLRANLAASRRALGADDPVTLEAEHRLGVLLAHAGRRDEAEATIRRALDARRRVLGPDHADTLRSLRALGQLLREQGASREAEAIARRYEYGVRCAVGTNHPDYVLALHDLGLVYDDLGRPDLAARYLRAAADEARRILGPQHPTAREFARDLDRRPQEGRPDAG